MSKLITETKNCAWCGKEFTYTGYNPKHTCSRKCAGNLSAHKVSDSTKSCLLCGNPVMDRSNFCSDECKRMFYLNDSSRKLVLAICEFCGKEFAKCPSASTKFCSKNCYVEALRSDPYTYVKNKKIAVVDKICEFCGREFEVWRHQTTAKFCSKECHYNSKPKVDLICKECGKEFTVQNHRKDAKFCSKKCAQLNAKVHKVANSINEKELLRHIKSSGYKIKTNLKIYHTNGYYLPDIVVDKKIIEYYGTFWHCDPREYKEDYYNKSIGMTALEKWKFDENRINHFISKGYKVLIIWEKDYQENKEKCLSQCLRFLEEV